MDNLPKLPHAVAHILLGDDSEDVFTADQMRAYALAAVEAEREACANECAKVYYLHVGPTFGEVRYGVAACQSAIQTRGKT